METVREQLVQRPQTKEDSYKKYGVFAAAVFLEALIAIIVMAGNVVFKLLGTLLVVLIAMGFFALMKSFNVEYEYCIAGSQLTVDKLINQNKRKTLCSIDLKSASAFYKSEKTIEEATVISAIGVNYEEDLPTYTIEYRDPKYGRTVLYFSPDERTLKMISPYLPKAI